MVRILDAADVRETLDLGVLLGIVESAFERQALGAVERPPRPHFPVGIDLEGDDSDDPKGTGLVMPAYIHGEKYFATKLVSVHDENPKRGLPTIHAQVVVADAGTGVPVAFMDGGYVTAARTSCIGGLAARELTDGPLTVGVIGAGTQGRWQVRAIAESSPVERVRFFDLDEDTKADAVAEIGSELGLEVSAAADADEAISGADIVVTTTTSPQPVFNGGALQPGTVVVAIGAYTAEMQEIDPTTFERAARVFADVPAEVAEIGDIRGADIDARSLIPFADLLQGDAGRESPDEIIVVESVGSAVMDAAAAANIYERAEAADLGIEVDLGYNI